MVSLQFVKGKRKLRKETERKSVLPAESPHSTLTRSKKVTLEKEKKKNCLEKKRRIPAVTEILSTSTGLRLKTGGGYRKG